MTNPALCFEDFHEGDQFESSRRTLTETDVVIFAGLTGDYNPLHCDAEFATQGLFGERIPHGVLGLCISLGLCDQLGIIHGSALALLGIQWKFVSPLRINETIGVHFKVAQVRETRHSDRGIVELEMSILNAKGELKQTGSQVLLIRRRGAV